MLIASFEENECKNVTEQIEYNQTLNTLIVGCLKGNDKKYVIQINEKLKSLIETLNLPTDDSDYKLEYVNYKKNENIIFIFEEKYLNDFNEGYLENIKLVEIINIDNGLFGVIVKFNNIIEKLKADKIFENSQECVDTYNEIIKSLEESSFTNKIIKTSEDLKNHIKKNANIDLISKDKTIGEFINDIKTDEDLIKKFNEQEKESDKQLLNKQNFLNNLKKIKTTYGRKQKLQTNAR